MEQSSSGERGWEGRGALCKAKSPAAWRASRRQWDVNAGWVHQRLLARGSRRERAQTWGRRPGVVPGPPCAPRPQRVTVPLPPPPLRSSPCSSSPARSGWGAGDRRAGEALRRPGSSPALGAWEPWRGAARPGEEGAEVSGLGDSPRLADPGSPCSRILSPGLGGRRAGQVGGGRGVEGRPWYPFRPLLLAVLPEPRGSPQVRPSRKEARRDLVPGRMCPKGKGPAGYFYQSLWVDAALCTVWKRCLANR